MDWAAVEGCDDEFEAFECGEVVRHAADHFGLCDEPVPPRELKLQIKALKDGFKALGPWKSTKLGRVMPDYDGKVLAAFVGRKGATLRQLEASDEHDWKVMQCVVADMPGYTGVIVGDAGAHPFAMCPRWNYCNSDGSSRIVFPGSEPRQGTKKGKKAKSSVTAETLLKWLVKYLKIVGEDCMH